MYKIWNYITNYSLLLIFGAITALIWANVDATSYHALVDYPLAENFFIGHPHLDEAGHIHRTLTLHYLFNDVLMAFFFAIAAKEVWEAVILKNGSLRGKKAATPLIATAGGMLGPVVVYLGLAMLFGSDTYDAVKNGWAVPTATDIAFSYLVGRLVFGAGHPAVRFLLLLAIADDAAGLVILAIFYPTGELAVEWLLLSLAAAILVFLVANWLPRTLDRHNQIRPNSTWVRKNLGFWPYMIAGCISWYGFMRAGIHPALGLLPIVPTIPHADRAFGIFADAEQHLHDLLNDIEHKLKTPVEVILFFFGLLNAGVEFNAIGEPTWLVLGGLLIGKPVGILIMGSLAAHGLRLGLPAGMRTIDLLVIGCVAAIGFTVSLFIASVAFDAHTLLDGAPVQDAAKMGALFSFAAAIISLVVGKLCKVKKQYI
ncbi:sodium:proton antiporter [Celeribacter ethanolicus]|uniref:Na(+)/H(+) antiporter NhaA n=1 Tax=Celeribacter ethanolicus TaxID=1758178 RepID=A0A291GF61_9RHOB|nr:Na+/H+ antiporter NhaA [Celeribacter ethanolicus]ATG49029.1 sodium:proton antiporter [Celeribacter ethanolicus]TNE63743.1 MAG: sodium:proton antiporter [Paracoccaceae bacterium]